MTTPKGGERGGSTVTVCPIGNGGGPGFAHGQPVPSGGGGNARPLSPLGDPCSVYHDHPLRLESRLPGGRSWSIESSWEVGEAEHAKDVLIMKRVSDPAREYRLIEIRFAVIEI